MSETLSAAQFAALDIKPWIATHREARASFDTGSFLRGTDFITRIAEVAEHAGHHPDVDLRYGRVGVALTSHDVGALTMRDADMARRISQIAAELGFGASKVPEVRVEIGIDAMDIPAVRPFWEAVLGYSEIPVIGSDVEDDVDLVGPDGRDPVVWFQQMDAPRPQRNRIHLDVYVPARLAPSRVAAAIAAGGTLKTDRFAPQWWVLADPEGNEACVCSLPPGD